MRNIIVRCKKHYLALEFIIVTIHDKINVTVEILNCIFYSLSKENKLLNKLTHVQINFVIFFVYYVNLMKWFLELVGRESVIMKLVKFRNGLRFYVSIITSQLLAYPPT